MKESQTVWLDMHVRFRRDIRWLSGAILLLGLTAVFDGQSNYDRLSEEYHFAVDLILEEQVQRAFEEEIKSVFVQEKQDNAPEWEELPSTVIVEMREIQGLHRTYVRALAAKKDKEVFKVGNQSLGLAAYTIALRYGPFILLLAMLWPLLSIRKLHRHLSAAAKPESFVQAKLNSLFFERITSHYGQGWRRHVFLSLTFLFVLALSTPIVFAATRTLVQADLRVAINKEGNIIPISDDPLTPRILMDIHSPLLEHARGELITLSLASSIVFVLLLLVGLTTIDRN